MLIRTRGIHDRPVAETPIAVFDFETTGLNPGYDRVFEDSRVPPKNRCQILHNRATRPEIVTLIDDAILGDERHTGTSALAAHVPSDCRERQGLMS